MDGAVVGSRGGGKEGEERAAFTIEGVEQERHNAGVRCWRTMLASVGVSAVQTSAQGGASLLVATK